MGLRLSNFGTIPGLNQKFGRKFTRKLGVNGKSKWIRQFKRSIRGYTKPTFDTGADASSASSYQYQPRTLSQLTGGV